MKLRLSRPGGSGAGSELWLKARHRRQGDERRHALRVALQLIEEDRHQLRVELRAAQPAQLVGGSVVWLRWLIRPAVNHRLVRVGDGHDARAERDVLATQPVRIAAAVEALVVVADDRREGARSAQRSADALADLGVA